jgi:predicted Zn finger-like uncharacterized protein
MAIRTSCPNCGQGYTLADSQQGKKVRCKSCAEPFEVWAGRSPDRAPAPARKRRRDEEDEDGYDRPPRRRARDDEEEADDRPIRRRGRGGDYEDEDHDDERPRKKKGAVPLWAWLVAGGGVAVLVIGVVLAAVLAGGGPKITEENYKKLAVGQTTEAEARAVLGKPTQVVDSKDAGKALGIKFDVGKTLLWKNGQDEVQAIFQNDKLAMKTARIGDKAFLGDQSLSGDDLFKK